MENYLKRQLEAEIERRMKSSGAVLIAGPKFCGKTTTASLFAKSIIKLNTDEVINIARMQPYAVMEGETPRLIDEWQTVPDLWNVTREVVDSRRMFGQFILTGSSTPADKSTIHHSGAGRITPVIMRPMSLAESLDSRATVSLRQLFDNPQAPVFDMNEKHQLTDMAYYICRGGWPLAVQQERSVALDVTRNYYDGLFNFENSDNPKFRNKKPEVLRMILRSYARNISSEASCQTLINDVIANENRTMNERTFDDYMDALKDLYILEDIDAWNPNLRSKTVVRTTSTRHFFDTSIACAALNITPDVLMQDLKTFGLMFEDMVIRDLKVYTMSQHGEVRHYRDSRGLECDAVIHLDDGRWAMMEVKLGGEDNVNAGAGHLKKLVGDLSDRNAPDLMMVITATGQAYRRSDGVIVVPLNCLRD